MELYNEKDVVLIEEKIDEITKGIDEKKLEIFEPTKKELLATNKIILDYIKEHKRKIYGGYAQNVLIKNKNPSDAFYDESCIPDIDFYSSDPINDLIAISNLLKEGGHKPVEGKEATHKETYSIFVNYVNVCDISYVPKNIYNKLPFIEIGGINYVHPSFINIDFYRIMSDPYWSGDFRWKKIFSRLYKLQKNYPFNKASKPLTNAYDVPEPVSEIVTKLHTYIFDQIKNKENYIIFGQYAYNILLLESGIMEDKKMSDKYKPINIPFLQIVSTNYIQDAATLIVNLKNSFKDLANDITFIEFYPFWMLTGYSTIVYYNKIPIIHITSNNKRCIPIKKVPAKLFINRKVKKDDGSIQIGCFDFIFLMNLVTGLRERVNMVEEKTHYHNIMTSHLIEMRSYYLNKNKKNLLDNTLFQSFIPTCIGPTIDPTREIRLIREKKYKEGKLVIFRYNPEEPIKAPDYKFANTSGNPINKDINFKITKYVIDPSELEKLKS